MLSVGSWFYYCLPSPLFKDPYSTIVNDADGHLLSAKIADDGQWRFPIIDTVPQYFKEAIISFEDKRFYRHIGVDFLALGRAFVQNIKNKRVVSGASTLSMQVIRLSRKGKSRTILEKIKEIILAIRLELSHSKEDIMRLYASHAPFGGNVVGIEAASWRYFQKDPQLLSRSEAAMLAVLPNAPALIHLSRNRQNLTAKRNRLLQRMYKNGIIAQEDYELALLEPIPEKPYALPIDAPHLMEFIRKYPEEKKRMTQLNGWLQQVLIEVGDKHTHVNAQSDIHNMALLVLETETGNVLGYLGNGHHTTQEKAVDMIQASRSSGSVLKPFLYAHMIDEGHLLPEALLQDTPTQIQGYKPKNYNRSYSGAIPASEALSMSLNVPAVRMLQDYGVAAFIKRLQNHGFSTIDKSADHYGLSLILGGAEVSLWELCHAYANMGATLKHFNDHSGKYLDAQGDESHVPPILSAGAIYSTFAAMQKVIRPGADGNWENFESSQQIAWKTGTSYGHRDAWAVGVSPKYTIGVWVGNADGEGKHGLVGVQKAGPILFDVVNRLEMGPFFKEPVDDLIPVKLCTQSGHLASPFCNEQKTAYVPERGQETKACPYHRIVHLDQQQMQVTDLCLPPSEMIHKSWFELPPAMAFYYRKTHPEYKVLPPFRKGCRREAEGSTISFIYPLWDTDIYLPVDLDGERQKVIFKATHRDPTSVLYWHLDDEYIGYTKEFHTMEITASPGQHSLTLVDESGASKSTAFHVVQ